MSEGSIAKVLADGRGGTATSGGESAGLHGCGNIVMPAVGDVTLASAGYERISSRLWAPADEGPISDWL